MIFYKNKISLPKWIHDIIKPIFFDLSADTLLLKCLHGETQNANECLNSLVWQKCPKSVFVTREVFEMAVYSAVLHFNDGGNGIREVLSSFGCDGFVTTAKTQKQDILQITRMEYKSRQPVKERRKTLRTIKKGYLDIKSQKEQLGYEAGGF